jgi:hypothetical protein
MLLYKFEISFLFYFNTLNNEIVIDFDQLEIKLIDCSRREYL